MTIVAASETTTTPTTTSNVTTTNSPTNTLTMEGRTSIRETIREITTIGKGSSREATTVECVVAITGPMNNAMTTRTINRLETSMATTRTSRTSTIVTTITIGMVGETIILPIEIALEADRLLNSRNRGALVIISMVTTGK